jgi:hypothetical protein
MNSTNLSFRFANQLVFLAELNTVNTFFLQFCYSFFIYSAVLNPVGLNSTCYPGIICDGTENSFYDCKFDRSQISTNISHLFAIITRCIGKLEKQIKKKNNFFSQSRWWFFIMVRMVTMYKIM